MRRSGVGLVLAVVALLAGCSLSPEEKSGREAVLKGTVDSFIHMASQSDWEGLLSMTGDGFDNADQLRNNITRSGVQDAVLLGGDIASMAWVNDGTAKVKINWVYQSHGTQSFSSETLIWTWKSGAWKYKGLSLR